MSRTDGLASDEHVFRDNGGYCAVPKSLQASLLKPVDFLKSLGSGLVTGARLGLDYVVQLFAELRRSERGSDAWTSTVKLTNILTG